MALTKSESREINSLRHILSFDAKGLVNLPSDRVYAAMTLAALSRAAMKPSSQAEIMATMFEFGVQDLIEYENGCLVVKRV